MVRRLLFVCARNVDRSLTAEEMFRAVEDIEVKSAGTSYGATVPITKELVQWADQIFVMEAKHEKKILKIDCSARQKIHVLSIPDKFYKNQPELRTLLQQKLRSYLDLSSMH